MDDLLKREELQGLMAGREENRVSIYMPTHRTGAEIQQDPIRLKNLLKEAEEQLVARGVRAAEARARLEPAQRLLDDELFWQHQSDGLALFRSSDTFERFRLPLSFDELVVVSDRFHVKPLIRVLSDDGRFYVLALSQKRIRLFQGTHYSVSEIELEDLPTSMDEALGYDNIEPRLQVHQGASGSQRQGIFHGHGDVSLDDVKENIRRFFRRVDAGVTKILRDAPAPLVLAGVDYLHPLYKEVSDYNGLMDEGIQGNPDGMSIQDLHESAWSIMRPWVERSQNEAAARFRQLVGTGRASADLRQILPAAYRGQVESLFVGLGVQRWGSYDPADDRFELHEEPEPGDEDLLDVAAAQTIEHGGDVFVVEPERVPDTDNHGPAAAVFRY